MCGDDDGVRDDVLVMATMDAIRRKSLGHKRRQRGLRHYL